MATAITLGAVGSKPAPIVLSTSEEAVTITASAVRTFQVWSATAWLYNSVAGQASPAPIAPYQTVGLTLRDASTLTFYASVAAGSGALHLMALADN